MMGQQMNRYCWSEMPKNAWKQGEMLLPMLILIPYVKYKDGIGLSIGNGISLCSLIFKKWSMTDHH